jgi:N-acetylmuramic acid 6-phosphate etherase
MNRPTESRNPATLQIDTVPTDAALALIIAEDARAVSVVAEAIPSLTELVALAHECVLEGGDIHYFGAGASGRLAFLDASELHPTYGFPRERLSAHFPGGDAALLDSAIDLEDADDRGELDAAHVAPGDLVIGIAASGATPYVAGALATARRRGARTALVTNTPDAELAPSADLVVVLDTGPEAVTGSTRMKAGTATKVALNAFSTALMIRLGYTYSNLMVGMVASNDKLKHRAVALLVEASGRPWDDCVDALAAADGRIPLALVMLLSGDAAADASELLRRHKSVRGAVEMR